jgi:outer membrane lipoprotein LolB
MFVNAGSPRRTSRATAAALVIAGLAAGGCVTRESVQLPDLSGWETRKAWLARADDWELSGRIGVKTRDDGFNGKLRWRQDGEAFTATVGGPLGVGTVRIEGDDGRVIVTDNDGRRTVLSDVEQDLYVRYGWTIPVDSLRYWALGIPDPSMPATAELNDEGQLARLEQRDWVVSISHYRESAGARMPFRLSAENHDTRVRIVIDDWYFYE